MGNLKERMVSGGGLCMKLARLCMRTLQFFLAVIVAGLYGVHINNERQANHSVDSRWVFALVVGGTSALTTIIYMLPKVPSRMFFPWDTLLCILWLIVFGIFAKLYIPMKNPEHSHEVNRMKAAVWVDVVSLSLWFITAVYGGIVFWLAKKGKLPTSRAEV